MQFLLIYLAALQTARLIDPSSGETKMEFRGHDNAVEVVVFAPVYAYPAIRELAGLTVRLRPAFSGLDH